MLDDWLGCCVARLLLLLLLPVATCHCVQHKSPGLLQQHDAFKYIAPECLRSSDASSGICFSGIGTQCQSKRQSAGVRLQLNHCALVYLHNCFGLPSTACSRQ